MSTHDRSWTDIELEAYTDGELDTETTVKLLADLESDPVLRSRLHAVRAADDLARRVLLGDLSPSPAPIRLARIRTRTHQLRWAAAACILLAAGTFVTIRQSRAPVDRPQSPAIAAADATRSTDANEASGELERDYRAVRVVLTLPLTQDAIERIAARRALRAAPGVPALAADDRSSDSPAPTHVPGSQAAESPAHLAFTAALERGRLDEAARLLTAMREPERAAAHAHIGATLRSAAVAQSLLDSMSPAEQIDLCRAWSADPALRPVLFGRLREMQSRSEVSQILDRTLQEMSRNAAVREQLLRHGLIRHGEG